METKREIDLEKARQYLVAIENAGKSLPEILIGFAEKETTSQQQTIERLREGLQEAIKLIQLWHGMGYEDGEAISLWMIYKKSPEMQKLMQLLNTTEP